MGRLPIYDEHWKQRVYELPLDVGMQVQRASERSGVSVDGICRAAIKAEQAKRGGPDLRPWIDVSPRPRRAERKTKAKKAEAQRMVWRIGVQICDLWDLRCDRLGVTGMIVCGLESLQLWALDGEQIRAAVGATSPAFVTAAQAAA